MKASHLKQKPKNNQKKTFQPIGDLFSDYQLEDKGGYITQEFQDFGYRMATQLEDVAHKSLYMKLAKTEERTLLERALSFVEDAQARNKAKLFMWKLRQLRTEKQVSLAKE